MSMTNKWVLLDRDGVINYDSKNYICTPEQWNPIPGSLEAIVKLNQNNYKVAVVTNQSGVGRNLFSIDTLDKIHSKFNNLLASLGGRCEKIYFCPHTPEAHCTCRKPKPGMLKQFFNEFNIQDKSNIFMVGDSLKDLQVAQSCNITPCLVLTGNGQETLTKLENYNLEHVMVKQNLKEIAEFIVNSNLKL